MKVTILCLISIISALDSFAQDEKDFTVSFAWGFFTSPYYKNSDARDFIAADFDYHLKKRHVLSANYNAGGHNYQDDVRSNVPAGNDLINSKADYRTFSVLYKYKFLDTKNFSAYGGSGLGLMTQILEYPYREASSSYTRQSSWTDLVFPVRLDVNYHVSNKFSFGVLGGFFVHPDYPVLGYHTGIKFSYNIQ